MSFILGRSSSPALARPRGYHITYLSMPMVDQFLSPYTRYSRCWSLPSVHCLYSRHHPLHGRQLVFPSSHWVPEFNYLNTMVGPLPQSHQQIDGSFRCLGAVHDILRSCSDQGDQAGQGLDELPTASLSSANNNVTPLCLRMSAITLFLVNPVMPSVLGACQRNCLTKPQLQTTAGRFHVFHNRC